MPTTTEKNLLHSVIDSLPPDDFRIVYRMFSAFIEDYLDTRLSEDEYNEHLQALKAVDEGHYVLLSSLPD